MTLASKRFQDVLASVLAALVLWACLQLAAPFGLPVGLAAALGGAAALWLLIARLREDRATASGKQSEEPRPLLDLSVRTARVTLLLMVVIALLLRIHTLLSRPAWADEMWTLRNIYTADWGELFRVAFDDYWPPLHYVILNALARVADTSLLWLRLPSVIFGTLTVALMYPLGLALFGNRLAALAGAALLTGMTSHILYSQEARVYSLLLLLAVASAYYFYTSYWDRRISIGFLTSTILLTYSHSFASWYFIAGECVYVVVARLIWKDREALRKGFLSQAIVLIAWLPLVGAFVYSRLARDIVVPTQWATGMDAAPRWMDVVGQYQGLAVRSWAGAAFLILLFAAAVSPLAKRPGGTDDARSRKRALAFLLCWVTVPIALSLAVTLATDLHTFGSTRYHLTVLPGLCLLGAAGLMQIRSRPALLAAWSLMLLLPASELPRYYRSFSHPAVDEAAELIRTRGSPQDLIYAGGDFRALAYYYRGIFPRIGSSQWDSLVQAHASYTHVSTSASGRWGDTYAYEKLPLQIRRFHDFPDTVPSVHQELARHGLNGTYWLVVSLPHDQSFLDRASRSMETTCASPDIYHVPGLELWHCTSGTPAVATGHEGVPHAAESLQEVSQGASAR